MKKIKKIFALLLTSAFFLGAAACGGTAGDDGKEPGEGTGETPPPEQTWETIGEDDMLIERPRVDDGKTYELLQDLNFSRGIWVTQFHSNSSGGVPAGYFDYGGKKAPGDYIWSVGQWGCKVDFLSAIEREGGFTRDGGKITYDDGSKVLSFDATKTGNIRVAIKGSLEYGQDEDGNWLDRPDVTYNWPHNIIGQEINCPDISDAEKIMMEVEYTVNSCDRLPTTPVNPDMHAAQFQWFITFTNKNPESPSYGESMWFGFSMFDTRSVGGTPSGMAAYDGGKEDNTGMFIYMFSLENAAYMDGNEVTLPTAVVGQKRTVKVDILPFVQAGLESAAKQGALEGAQISDLMIGSTNIGIELPGSYDVDVQIHSMNMYKVIRQN